MPSILIIEAPVGEAPDWVREAWIGCELEGATGLRKVTVTRTVSQQSNPQFCSFAVPRGSALIALGEHNEEAVSWYARNLPEHATLLNFNEDACEVIPA